MTSLITRWRLVAGLGLALLALAGAGPASAADAAIPLATFFSNDDIADAKLSPSGRFLALAVAAKSGRKVLAVVEIDAKKPPVVVASDPLADIRSFDWVNDERLIYNVIDLQSAASDQTFGPGLFSVKRDGTEARLLIRVGWDSVTEHTTITSNVLGPDHGLLFVPSSGGNDVIVGEVRRDGAGDVVAVLPKRLDVTTGRSRSAAIGAPAGTLNWVFDRTGEPRVARRRGEGSLEVLWREPGKDTWRSLLKAGAFDAPWYPFYVDAADRLYVTTGSTLRRFDFAAGAPEATALVSTPGFDTYDGLIFDHDDDKRLLGVRVDTDAETTVWLDPELKKLQALADARFPDRVNRITCRGCLKDGVVLVESFSDRDPGTYAIYRPSTSEWTTIGRARRVVDPQQMAVLDFQRIKTRDGLDMPVWVTTPRGKAAAPRPAVVLVHGGPWMRGTHWRWSEDAQFLASRGYVVIEPEYRGSTGFGHSYFTAGFKSWGTTMQDDVADAVRWATEKGLVDGKRVCIAGASYGGYATLMGAIRYPDLYRCGVAWVAVTDPRLLFEPIWRSDASAEARRYSLPTLIGDPVKDAAMLKAATPVERAGEIKIPMLLAFGGEDRRVPIDHGTRMRAAMQAAGQQPEYVVYDGEGHGWLKLENRIDFWQRVEKFLAKHLN